MDCKLLLNVVKHIKCNKYNFLYIAMQIDVVSGKCHDYCNFERLTRRISSSMYKRGMRKGDTAIYLTYDMINIHAFFCGVWRANGIVRASYPEDDEGKSGTSLIYAWECLLSQLEVC